jgi:hypothetical protein
VFLTDSSSYADSSTETKHPALHRFQEPSTRCWLLDTPGFDDTHVSDIEVFQDIVLVLSELASKGVSLSMVYLHRIIDVRFGGVARRSLDVFRLLCGDPAMKNVTLVSTFWDAGDPEAATRREKELMLEQFWGGMIRNGARACRHLGTRASAWNIVQPLLQKKSISMLQIQRELGQEKKTLNETAAGQYLLQDIEKVQARYESDIRDLRQEMIQVLQENDQKFAEVLKQEQERFIEQMKFLHGQRDRLQLRLKDLQEQASKMATRSSGEEG